MCQPLRLCVRVCVCMFLRERIAPLQLTQTAAAAIEHSLSLSSSLCTLALSLLVVLLYSYRGYVNIGQKFVSQLRLVLRPYKVYTYAYIFPISINRGVDLVTTQTSPSVFVLSR